MVTGSESSVSILLVKALPILSASAFFCLRLSAQLFIRCSSFDVMMAADIVSAASGKFEKFEFIAVFSDDTDLYPALADATAHHEKVILFKPRQTRDDGETSMLRSLGVDVRLSQ